jgi:hypothetical protein
MFMAEAVTMKTCAVMSKMPPLTELRTDKCVVL